MLDLESPVNGSWSGETLTSCRGFDDDTVPNRGIGRVSAGCSNHGEDSNSYGLRSIITGVHIPMPLASGTSQEQREQFHDAASYISNLSMSVTPGRFNTSLLPPPKSPAEDHVDLKGEAEDKFGELQAPALNRSTKRFSASSLASSLALIVPFITAAEKSEAAINLGNEQDAKLRSDVSLQTGQFGAARNRRHFRRSIPQVGQLLQRAAANAQLEQRYAANSTLRTVNEWVSSLDSSFSLGGPGPELSLSIPLAPASGSVKPLTSSQSKLANVDTFNPKRAEPRWKLRPLSTWGRRSMLGHRSRTHQGSLEPLSEAHNDRSLHTNLGASLGPGQTHSSNQTRAASGSEDLSLPSLARVRSNGTVSPLSSLSTVGDSEPLSNPADADRTLGNCTVASESLKSTPSLNEVPKTKDRKRARFRKFWHSLMSGEA